MDKYEPVPFCIGSSDWDIQTDKGRRLNVRLDKEAADEICIELNAAYEGKAYD